MFNFDIKKTQVLQFLKIGAFPLVRYAGFFSWLFAYASLMLAALLGMSFLGFSPPIILLKLFVIGVICSLVFLEIRLFFQYWLRQPLAIASLADVLADADNYNIAEFLSLEAGGIVDRAIKICKKRKLSTVSSEALLYVALLINADVKILVARLGIDVKKVIQDLKNHIEKQERQKIFSLSFSSPFENVMMEALRMAKERGLRVISEKELLVALAIHDDFFKKVMVEYDLKHQDVKNVAFWLDTIEYASAQRRKFWLKENLAQMGSLGKNWAAGFTVTLDQFSIDWTQSGRGGVFNEIIGHNHEIQEVETVLAKSSFKNALIVGAEGSGRKSIIRAVSQRAFLGLSLPELNRKRLIELDMIALLAKVQDPERVESLLDQIFREIITAGDVILIIDNLENFVENTVARPGTIDISGILAKYLALPHFQFIGIVSFDGLHRKLENNPSFLEYFSKVEVAEVLEADAIHILQNMAIGMEKKYALFIPYPSVRETVNLTSRYLPSLPFPKKAIDILEEAVSYANSLKEKTLHVGHIAKVISDKTQIPVGKMEFKEKSVLLNLEQLIHEKIVGQKEAVSEISIAMRRARSGISNKKRPMGTFLFLGPTGVGKTETAKALADIYFNGVEKMIRLDMSEFQSLEDIPRLLGASGEHQQQGLLTTPVRENPFSLVLFDEIEKAHKDILNLLLQVLDDGYITDGQGRKVVFSNTIIICTSNAGAQDIFKAVQTGAPIQKDALLAALFEKGIFRPEFVNRFDASVIFHPLTKENLMDIAELAFASLAKNLQEKEIELIITEPVKQKIVELSYKPQFGAREMRRVMQDKIENKIADALLSDKVVKGNKIEINPENFDVVVIK